MITFNMLIGCCTACLFVGVFFGFFTFALVSINRQTDEEYEAQSDDALIGYPGFDERV